jgi:rRNA maturation endonuclease Nob1
MSTQSVPYEILKTISSMGTSRHVIRCAGCRHEFTAYIWSLAGSGKRCPSCGVLHTHFGAYLDNTGRGKK